MPNLEREAVTTWVRAVGAGNDGALPELIRAVEDDADHPHQLARFGDSLGNVGQASLEAVIAADGIGADFSDVLRELGTARLLSVLAWLGEDPAGVTILRALDEGAYRPSPALRDTLRALHQHALLEQIFSADRLAQLLAATRDAKKGDRR